MTMTIEYSQSIPLVRPAKRRMVWLDIARVLATLLIILFHVPSSAFFRGASPHDPAWCLLHFYGSAGAAIAFFFAISAYLTPVRPHLRKVASKVVALAIPYIIWNLICAPGLRDELSLGRIFGLGSPDALCADYPLWFVRDLIFLLLLLPLYERFSALVAAASALLILIPQARLMPEFAASIPLPRAESWLFFSAGLLARRLPSETWRRLILASAPLWLGLSLVSLFMAAPHPELFAFINIFSLLATGILLEKAIKGQPQANEALRLSANATFLCYAVHAPILLVLGKATARLSPSLASQSWPTLALPLLIFAGSVAAFRLLQTRAPRLLPLLAHARTPKPDPPPSA